MGPLASVMVSALASGGFALPNSTGTACPEWRENDSLRKEKRYVSIYITEDPGTRWHLPAIVSVRAVQDESCAIRDYRRVDTVYWQDGAHTDFAGCLLLGNFFGDCTDDQGRRWRVKVFAKTSDEIPREYNYPESSIPSVRRLLGER
jgi:hypothetical protein